LLVEDQAGRGTAPRQTRRQCRAQAEQRVIPATGERRDRQVREIRVLCGEQRANERHIDRDLSGGRPHARFG
jgi:hypothetical protein